MKIGLKLWSINTDAYLLEAERLHGEGVFGYIELYVVPGTNATIAEWKRLKDDHGIPFAIHAPHSQHGVNLADPAKKTSNLAAFAEVKDFADALGAGRIIAHGGVLGSIDEIIRQMKLIGDQRILIENKPYLPIDRSDRRLAGSTPDEIRRIMVEVNCGFCLDLDHMIAAANAHRADWREWFTAFLALHPSMFHLSDMQVDSEIDQHLHYGFGSLPSPKSSPVSRTTSPSPSKPSKTPATISTTSPRMSRG